jgi:Protein of unknown function (DUF3489)
MGEAVINSATPGTVWLRHRSIIGPETPSLPRPVAKVRRKSTTEWQQHSVRGFLAGVIRNKLGLNLVSEKTDKGRVYRIKDGKASSTTVDRVKQTA